MTESGLFKGCWLVSGVSMMGHTKKATTPAVGFGGDWITAGHQ